jgi:hypothetical protein
MWFLHSPEILEIVRSRIGKDLANSKALQECGTTLFGQVHDEDCFILGQGK